MTREDIVARVTEHYSSSEDILLLSDLGEALRDAGLWPIEGERRTLAEVVQTTAPDLSLVRDPEARAYVIVVPRGREDLANSAIERRYQIRLLRKLSRAVLVAFCVDAPPDAQVYLRVDPPVRYVISKDPPDNSHIIVESEFRVPGLYIDEGRNLSADEAEKLISSIKSWGKAHEVELERLFLTDKPPRADSVAPNKTASGTNALERLYSVQAPGVAERLIVPIDIALLLSRQP